MKNHTSNLIAIILFLLISAATLIGATLGTTPLSTSYNHGIQVPIEEPITIAAGTYALDVNPSLTTGDGKAWWIVPSCYDGWYVTAVGLYAVTASTSGIPTFQITNTCRGLYLCDQLLTIDQDEFDSRTAATAATLYSTAKVIYSGDALRWDCSVAGTGTKKVKARLVISPTP